MKTLFFIFVMTILAGTNVQGACLDDWPSTWCSQVVELEMCDVTDYGLFKENLTLHTKEATFEPLIMLL